MQAKGWCCFEAAKQAIEDGADVDVREGRLQRFPLFYAAQLGFVNNLEIVQLLIDAGCDLNQVDGEGWTALNSVVVSGGKVSIVEALLRGGANPNIANKYGKTPCHWAKTVEVVELLFDYGADPRIRDRGSREAPFQCRRNGGDDVEPLRAVYEAWTPHRMLPRWTPSAFPLYVDQCDGFKHGIITLLLCLRRYRHVIHRGVGMMIVKRVAEMHKREMWWPAYQDFDMEPYMGILSEEDYET